MLIGEYLVKNNVIKQEEVDKALEIQKAIPQKKLGEILVEMKIITIDILIKYLDLQLKDKSKNRL